MTRGFLDTNIAIYYYTLTEGRKREIAGSLWVSHELVISTQVLSETCNVLRKKFGWEWSEIHPIVLDLRRLFEVTRVDENTIDHAIEISQKSNTPYFDSLMLASAFESNCPVIYSEDFQHNQVIEGVRVVNPFL